MLKNLIIIMGIILFLPPIVLAVPSFDDNFTRADNAAIGGSWSEGAARLWSISSNNLYHAVGDGDSEAYLWNTAYGALDGFKLVNADNSGFYMYMQNWATDRILTLRFASATQLQYYSSGWNNCPGTYTFQADDWIFINKSGGNQVYVNRAGVATNICDISTTYNFAQGNGSVQLNSGTQQIRIAEYCSANTMEECFPSEPEPEPEPPSLTVNCIEVIAPGVYKTPKNCSGIIANATWATSDLLPSVNNTVSLGNASLYWKDLYLSNASLYVGGLHITKKDFENYQTLSNWTMNGTNMIIFNISSVNNYTYINNYSVSNNLTINLTQNFTINLTNVTSNNNGIFIWRFSNGMNFTTNNLSGMQGPAGQGGMNGTNGATGPAGNNGTNGIPGPAGANGTNAYNITINLTNIVNYTVNTTQIMNYTNNFTLINNYTNNITTNLIQNYTNNLTNNISTIQNFTTYQNSWNLQYSQSNIFLNGTTFVLMPNLTFTLEASKLYSIRCMIMTATQTTANAARVRFNYTGTITTLRHQCNTFTSGTAVYTLSVNATLNLDCASTASIGNNLPTPFNYQAVVRDDGTPSIFNVYLYGEAVNTSYVAYDGSYCEYKQLN
jgi:hypothetical protein